MRNLVKRTLIEGLWYTLSMSSDLAVEFVNILFVSFYGEKTIAGVGMYIAVYHLVLFSIVIGFNSAIQTLGSQSFGRGDRILSLQHFQRGRTLSFFMSFTSVIIFLNVKNLLSPFVLDESTLQISQNFSYLMLPGILLFQQFDLLRQYLCILE